MIHERGYWLSTEETETHVCDKPLSDAIVNLDIVKNEISTVVDIGCGNGAYTINFLNNGINCIGFDGSPLTSELTNNLCSIKDFSEYQDIGQFDLVLSLEVGEHIPKEYEDIFINNLCNASKKYLIISWAIIGQGGDGHVNCQNNDYVINEMKKRNFYFDLNTSNFLRNKSTFSWFKNTIMVFIKI